MKDEKIINFAKGKLKDFNEAVCQTVRSPEKNGEARDKAKKLTKEEIQPLSDDELNFYLYRRHPDYDETQRFRPEDVHDFCNSLDAQFELAEKLKIGFKVERLKYATLGTNHYYLATASPALHVIYYAYFNLTESKRASAEVLLEAIQELKESK